MPFLLVIKIEFRLNDVIIDFYFAFRSFKDKLIQNIISFSPKFDFCGFIKFTKNIIIIKNTLVT